MGEVQQSKVRWRTAKRRRSSDQRLAWGSPIRMLELAWSCVSSEGERARKQSRKQRADAALQQTAALLQGISSLLLLRPATLCWSRLSAIRTRLYVLVLLWVLQWLWEVISRWTFSTEFDSCDLK